MLNGFCLQIYTVIPMLYMQRSQSWCCQIELGPSYLFCIAFYVQTAPSQPGGGGTQLSFWYRCVAQRATNGGLKDG